MAGGLAVAGAIALVAPSLLSSQSATDRDRAPTGDPTHPQEEEIPPIRWTPRGDLVPNLIVVNQLVARMLQDYPEAERVLAVTTLPDGARLLLAGIDVERGIVATSVRALYWPAGRPFADVRHSEVSSLTSPEEIVAWAVRGRGGHVHAVVLGAPGSLRVSLSPRVSYAFDGAASREWSPVGSDSGLVVRDLGDRTDPVIGVRPEPSSRFPTPFAVRVNEAPGRGQVLPPVTGIASDYRGPDRALLREGLRASFAAMDVRRGSVRVIWSGSIGRNRRLALVRLRRADGVTFQTLLGQQDENWFPAGLRAVPRATADASPWLLEPFSSGDSTLLLCPSGPGSIVYARPGRRDRVLPINSAGIVGLVPAGGSAPSAAGANVTVRGPDGVPIVQVELVGGSVDVLALESGPR